MHRLAGFCLVWLMGIGIAYAQQAQQKAPTPVPEKLEIGISTREIAITPDFRGADLTIFGVINDVDTAVLSTHGYDVAVTLEGPEKDVTVRRKARVFGIWINRELLTFARVPLSYSIASTRPIGDITSAAERARLGVGIDDLPLNPTHSFDTALDIRAFRAAFLRQQRANGLYQSQTNKEGVRFVSANLFQASLRLPANIPAGGHVVHAYLFRNGSLVSERQLALTVVKTGLEQAITDAAHHTPIAYGCLAVLFAVITGWGASLLFRKD